jgi:glutamate-ammonia-ligase adenylyltransferase
MQQLIWGGRIAELRSADTCGALTALARAGRIGEDAAQTLITAYRFLRGVEHRLQMIDDRQTQTLPPQGPGLEAFARFMGYESGDAFGLELVGHLRAVERIYAELFEEQPDLSGPATWSSPGPKPIRKRSRPWKAWASAMAPWSARRFAAGITAVTAPRVRPVRASF